ncbi:RNA-dependent RNA polymerase [Quillaja saponaria]|uniref:RNA-dependent RNA polymerase n=1 Tax=Quillaja saponaria TaxID=32244 RepID=A0AAD7Q2S6_QUISA|nr:RNA-dependent RNA polymerase [Quillaja saponaria]
MADQEPLPQSVEQLITRICAEQNQRPPEPVVRQKLAQIGEERAVEILTKIASTKIKRSLDGFIIYMINNNSPRHSPKKIFTVSPHRSSGTSFLMSQQSSPGTSVSQPQITENLQSPRCLISDRVERPHFSPAIVALGELEFRKAFLILSYIGEKNPEEAISADKIRSLKELPMHEFEPRVWEAVGQHDIKNERLLSSEWDSEKTHLYYCHVGSDGSTRFKGPYLETTRTLLQKALGDDNVLIVKFAGNVNGRSLTTSSQDYNAHYRKLGEKGILVGLRRYRFFVFKDGGKEGKQKDSRTSSVKCYFVRMESSASIDKGRSYILSNKTVSEARCMFMRAHTLPNVAEYMARFSLVLSKTITLDVDLASVNIQKIPEIFCKEENGDLVYHNGEPRIHTDGTGFISEDLALLCPRKVTKGKSTKHEIIKNELEALTTREPPLLIQFRLFHKGCAIKGTVLLNKELPHKTIQVRPSMVKIDIDPNSSNVETVSSMEIVGTSNQPKRAFLSRNLIALLSYGGVPDEYFMDILNNALADARGVRLNKHKALRVAINYGELDDFQVATMILSGVPLDESYVQHHLSILQTEEFKSLKGGKLHVPNCFYLMGTVDPTGLLKRDEVCIIMEHGQLNGEVMVYRNPGLHIGDIHVCQATYVSKLESYVGNSKYAIFFPCVGSRSIGDEIAGGDFDGDMYWVCKNSQLLAHFKRSEPWMPNSVTSNVGDVNSREVRLPSDEKLEEELFELFLSTRFQPSYAVAEAAGSWVALMDRILTPKNVSMEEQECVKKKLFKLIDLYYEALDAPKKGGRKVDVPKKLKVDMFPHYMERDSSFYSTSVLGKIYDRVVSFQTDQQLTKEVKKLPSFDIELPKSCLDKWGTLYIKYREDMKNACQHDNREIKDGVIKKYKKILYEADELEVSSKSMEGIYNEALAIYNITYDYAKHAGVEKCKFAWKVAGSALLKLYAAKHGDRLLTCHPSVLREMFCW